MDQLLSKRWKISSALPIVVFIVILVFLVAFIGLRASLAKKSASDAMQKLKAVDDLRLKAMAEAKLADNEEARKQAEKKLEELDVQLSTIAGQVSARRVVHQKYVQSLQSITDWDDVMVIR
jgi:5-bromo-4-chloroindolyl phosphate hydrolysis protein